VVREEDGALLAIGETEHCFMGRDGRPGRPPALLAEILARAPRAPAGLDDR
jgi:hypothetical protein